MINYQNNYTLKYYYTHKMNNYATTNTDSKITGIVTNGSDKR